MSPLAEPSEFAIDLADCRNDLCLRDLTAKARRGEFSLGSMLMAQMRANPGAGRKAG